jgi:hypothetical protein
MFAAALMVMLATHVAGRYAVPRGSRTGRRWPVGIFNMCCFGRRLPPGTPNGALGFEKLDTFFTTKSPSPKAYARTACLFLPFPACLIPSHACTLSQHQFKLALALPSESVPVHIPTNRRPKLALHLCPTGWRCRRNVWRLPKTVPALCQDRGKGGCSRASSLSGIQAYKGDREREGESRRETRRSIGRETNHIRACRRRHKHESLIYGNAPGP